MAGKKASGHQYRPTTNKAQERGRHFAAISIKSFRCFEDFSMASFERINLIGGKNNVGKTTLLEALFLLLGATNISLILKINAFRGVETFEGDSASIRETLWNHLFYNFNNQATIAINGELGIGGQIGFTLRQIGRVPTTLPLSRYSHGKTAADSSEVSAQALRLQYKDVTGKTYPVELRVDAKGIVLPPPVAEPLFQGIIHPDRRRPSHQENAIRYGQLELDKAESHYDLVLALKLIEPRLNRLSTIVGASGPMIYGDIGLGRMLPLAMMGDGLVSLASLLLSISSASGGVVLIDEIENGLHYSVMVNIWQAIAKAARIFDTQIFATTHSWDCIKAAHEAFQANGLYDLRYHRLQKADEIVEAVTLDQNTLQTTIEAGWEIR